MKGPSRPQPPRLPASVAQQLFAPAPLPLSASPRDINEWLVVRLQRAEKLAKTAYAALEQAGASDPEAAADAASAAQQGFDAITRELEAAQRQYGSRYDFSGGAALIERHRRRVRVAAAEAAGLESLNASGRGAPISAEELRLRMLVSADAKLAVGEDDAVRGGHISHWSLEAVQDYKMLGVSEEEIARKTARRLDAYLAVGREQGYSRRPELLQELLAPPQPADADADRAPQNFASKYDLDRYRRIHHSLGVDSRYGASPGSYKIGLDDAFTLAAQAGDAARAEETLLHMFRLGAHDGIARLAPRHVGDPVLFAAGAMALVEFFYGASALHANHAWDAIEALKRVSGPLKPLAAAMLRDFAALLSSPLFLTRAGDMADMFLHRALKALRATGTVLEQVQEDSVKVDFLSDVSDPAYARPLRALARKLLARPRNSYFHDEIVKALGSVKDAQTLRALAREQLARIRQTGGSAGNELLWALSRVEETDLLNELGEAILAADPNTSHGWFASHYRQAALYFGAARNLDGIARAASAFALSGGVDRGYFEEGRLAALALASGAAPVAAEEPDPLARRLAANRGLLAKISAETTRLERAVLSIEGRQALREGKAWEAYQLFVEALDRDGLIDAADAVARVDPFQAWSPYFDAFLLTN